MRLYVVRALLRKEALRLVSQRGPLAMALLIVVTALLVSTLGTRALGGGSGAVIGQGDARRCVVDYWKDDPLLRELERAAETERELVVELRSLADHSGFIRYPRGSVGIQLRPSEHGYRVSVWHPAGALWERQETECERWFWRELRRQHVRRAGAGLEPDEREELERELGSSAEIGLEGLREVAHEELAKRLARYGALLPKLEVKRAALGGRQSITVEHAIAMGLVLLALFFVGVFLLPSITCEERERKLHHAIALSPASAGEIVAAKIVFYVVLATALGLVVAVIGAPRAIGSPLLWASIPLLALGQVGIGMTIASIARTQRGASTGALLYLLSTSVVLLTFRQTSLEPLAWLLLERHGPELLLAAFSGQVARAHGVALAITSVLALAWVLIATIAYRRTGWR